MEWIDPKIKLPEFGGEYNVVWDLNDGLLPTTTTMEFDFDSKKWIDVIGGVDSDETENILYWCELPELPEHLKIKNKL